MKKNDQTIFNMVINNPQLFDVELFKKLYRIKLMLNRKEKITKLQIE